MKRHKNKTRRDGEMWRMRRFGLCLMMVVLAAGAVAAASAMAERATEARFENCEKVGKFNGHYTGLYTESACATVSATHEGAYELSGWKAGDRSSAFKIKSGESVLYVYAPVERTGETREEELKGQDGTSAGIVWKVECAKGKGAGEITSYQESRVQITYSKCTGKPEPGGTAVQCTSAAGKGKIETTKLDTALEEIMDMGEEVNLGLMLRGEENEYSRESPGAPVAAFECGATKFAMRGGLGRNGFNGTSYLNACSKTVPFSSSVSFAAGQEGAPKPWAEASYGSQGNEYPLIEVNGVLFGAGFETTATLTDKGLLCPFNEFPMS